MTIDEAIKHEEKMAENQEVLYKFCPASESEFSYCDGAKDCKILKNGKNEGCLKCAKEYRQLAEWLKELKQLREQPRYIPVSSGRLPENEQKVLFRTTQGDIHQGIYYADNKWYSRVLSTWIYFDSILDWMPLPQSCNTESEEQEITIKEHQEHLLDIMDSMPDDACKDWKDSLAYAIDIIRKYPKLQSDHKNCLKTDFEDIFDKIKADINQIASRYTISRERGGMGQVEWEDRLIKEADILQILDKYKTEQKMHELQHNIPDYYVNINVITQILNNMDRYIANELILCDTNKKFPQNEVFIVDDVYEEIVEKYINKYKIESEK